MRKGPWPRSLLGQMLLAVAVALLLAQGLGTALLYRAQAARRDAALIHTAAFRLMAAAGQEDRAARFHAEAMPHGPVAQLMRGVMVESANRSPLGAGDRRDDDAEDELRRFLVDDAGVFPEVVVLRRDIAVDPPAAHRLAMRALRHPAGRNREEPEQVLIAAVHQPDSGQWLVARILVPGGERWLFATLLGQTLMIYIVLVGAIALILQRITKPLAALTNRLEQFAKTPGAPGELEPEGPQDVRRLIAAHNAMEQRISALLDEKDVMLGAIGHDLKTPLAALRVRIESVDDEAERERMAGTIEDIVRSLDDILSLARVGRPSDPLERSELSALVAAVVEEFEDMGEPVELGDTRRIALPLRVTWLRRALRNLISNALRYGHRARVSVRSEGGEAVISIEDDGPGIPEADIARMLEPFTRGEPSRNSETGGTGLGLTLSRAIAQQHGGTLRLANRRNADGTIVGMTATLSLPLAPVI